MTVYSVQWTVVSCGIRFADNIKIVFEAKSVNRYNRFTHV